MMERRKACRGVVRRSSVTHIRLLTPDRATPCCAVVSHTGRLTTVLNSAPCRDGQNGNHMGQLQFSLVVLISMNTRPVLSA